MQTADGRSILFREVQAFRIWMWVIVATMGPICCLFIYFGFTMPRETEIEQFHFWIFFAVGCVPTFAVTLGLTWLFYAMQLISEVRADGVHYRFAPFHRSYRVIPYEDITSCAPRQYRPIAEYGGWGIRHSWSGKGKAYNVSGDEGIQFELRDRTRLLLGSQRAAEFYAAIETGQKSHRPLPA